MSILIKGLEMPKDGAFVEVLIWSDGHVTKTGDSFLAEDGKHYYKPCDWEYFSAIPVPKHGDLIDREPFIQFIKTHWDSYDQWFVEHLEARPTIIPADTPVMHYPQVDGITPTIIPAEEHIFNGNLWNYEQWQTWLKAPVEEVVNADN